MSTVDESVFFADGGSNSYNEQELNDFLNANGEEIEAKRAQEVIEAAEVLKSENARQKAGVKRRRKNQEESILRSVEDTGPEIPVSDLDDARPVVNESVIDAEIVSDSVPKEKEDGNSIDVSSFDRDDGDTLMYRMFCGLTARDNEYRSYYEDKGKKYYISLGNDVTKIYGNMVAVVDEIGSGKKSAYVARECDDEEYRIVRRQTWKCFGEVVDSFGDNDVVMNEELALKTLEAVKKDNSKDLVITGFKKDYDRAFIVDAGRNIVGMWTENGPEILPETPLSNKLKNADLMEEADMPEETVSRKRADFPSYTRDEIDDIVRKAGTVKVDTQNCSQGWLEKAFTDISKKRKGNVEEIAREDLERLGLGGLAQAFTRKGVLHERSKRRTREMEITRKNPYSRNM